jgi:hypothetical protein
VACSLHTWSESKHKDRNHGCVIDEERESVQLQRKLERDLKVERERGERDVRESESGFACLVRTAFGSWVAGLGFGYARSISVRFKIGFN